MEQLLIHLFSDYWLQNDYMALNKKKDFKVALLHSFVYTLPFLLLTRSFLALFVIFITHAIIDGTDIVNQLNQIKNWNFKDFFIWGENKIFDGYEANRPPFLRVWLIIIQDNILHLIINYLAIKYF